MNTNLSTVYENELYKTKKMISKLRSIQLDTSIYEEMIEKITSECEKENKECRTDIYRGGTIFQKDYLTQNYNKAIKRLISVQKSLQNYEIYIKINSFIELLRTTIINKELTHQKLTELEGQLRPLLEEVISNEELDYINTSKLIESFYQVAYYLMKEEIKQGNNSLFNYFIKDQRHSIYLDKIIAKELEELYLNNKDTIQIKQRKEEIDSQGFNGSYLDYKLLNIIIFTANKEDYKEEIKTLEVKLNEVVKNTEYFLYRLIPIKDQMIEENKKEIKRLTSPVTILSKLMPIIISTSLTLGAYIAPYQLSKKHSSEEQYKTTITTKDDKNNIIDTPQSFYSSEYEPQIIITKYDPYKKNINGFYRTVTSYSITDMTDISLDDLDLQSIKSLVKDTQTYDEKKKTLTTSDMYNEPYYTITQITIDQNDKTLVLNSKDYVGLTCLIHFMLTCFLTLAIPSILNERKLKEEIITYLKEVKDMPFEIEHNIKYKKYLEDLKEKTIENLQKLLMEADSDITTAKTYVEVMSQCGNSDQIESIQKKLDIIYEAVAYLDKNNTPKTKVRTRNK